MKTNGNIVSNRRYNPRQQKPNIPIDADEVDGAMERFIREKYQHKTLCGEGRPLPSIKHHTGSSSGSSNDVPPPLPAKNTPRLSSNLRSSSSMYPHASNSLPSPPASELSSSGSRRMAGIPEDGPISRDQSFDGKLDTQRTGNQPVRTNTSGSTQVNGIIFDSPTSVQTPNGVSSSNTVPQHKQSASNSSNPFSRPTAFPAPQVQAPATQSFEQSFQNLSMNHSQQQTQPQSQTQPQQHTQNLFPNNTGSWTTQATSSTNLQNNPFLKTFTPPISPSPYHYQSAPLQQPTSNPFLRSSQSQTFPSSNPFGHSLQVQIQTPQVASMSPWSQQAQTNGQQATYSNPQQSPRNQQNLSQQQNVQYPTTFNLPVSNQSIHFQQQPPQNFLDTSQQQQTAAYPQGYNINQLQQLQYQQSQQPQMRPLHDKSSILALYNSPNTSPQNMHHSHPQVPQQPYTQGQQVQQAPPQPLQQRSVTMPIMPNGNHNPFLPAASQPSKPPSGGPGHISRESMAFTAGRSPSPDAFSGLSAAQWR